jgi:thiamine-phosphate pyrophosphorylase
VLLYYITDRTAFADDETTRRRRLLEKIAEAASAGVDYIQLREKDLSTRELESLAFEALHVIKRGKSATDPKPVTPGPCLLINSRTDVALAAQADGVHLRSRDITAQEVRTIWKCGAGAPAREISPRDPIISVSCHSPEEVHQAAANQATLALFAPVFEKKDSLESQPAGLDSLRQACRAKIPVLALGGTTLQNAHACLEAGAAGIAAIRLFQENDVARIVRQLR